MRVEVYTPKSALLRQLIDCFYFLEQVEADSTVQYFTLPTTLVSLSLFIGDEPVISGNNITLSSKLDEVQSVLATNFSMPKLISYDGPFRDINIYFKPLGINAFVEQPLSHYVTSDFNLDFFPYEGFEKWLPNLLAQKNTQIMFEWLEAYLLSKYRGFEHPILVKAMTLIQENFNIDAKDLAEECGVSTKTLNKYFQMHVTRSVTNFRKVHRFRQTLDSNMLSASQGYLTGLAHTLQYFDQSHMIKDFKALTGLSPKQFFNQLYSHPDGSIHWRSN